MPRQYGGLNLPNVVFSMLSEMISSADAGFQNIWSLQSCIDTLYEFGTDEQRAKYIPRISNGETMSMDLTEPDAVPTFSVSCSKQPLMKRRTAGV